ncbi:hypothetical protein [Thermosipho melanesiensis]|uniref:hypothetical protein n=1 Tax=Thermosipho melanesiensis TaxID=46541 RepID=UPI0000ED3580|nr:hypothetical protein [Thermosipho melanesiensis]
MFLVQSKSKLSKFIRLKKQHCQGDKTYSILSTGEKYSIADLTKYEMRFKRLYRKFSKKQKGSKNREKERLRLAKYIEKINNIKND